MSRHSAIFGGQAGFNYQIGWFVFGFEADGSSVRIKGSGEATTKDGSTTWHIKSETDWVATVRGRMGAAFDRVLIYGTAGVAFGGVKSTNDVTCAGCDPSPWASGSASRTHAGWTVGAGAEYMLFDNLTLRAEYLFIDLNENTQQFVGTAHGVADYNTDSFHPSLQMHTVRGGLNFKF
jgi:outer membrane immunogenic protein